MTFSSERSSRGLDHDFFG
jgi:hypothetical protein